MAGSGDGVADAGSAMIIVCFSCLFWCSSSAARCSAASTNSFRSLKSCEGHSSGGVGGGVLKRPPVGLAVPRLEIEVVVVAGGGMEVTAEGLELE